jgi:prevent-host-death family protein
MKRTMSAAEAKTHFAACLRFAEQGRAIVITRHGRPVAAMVSAEEVEQLRRLRAAGAPAGLAAVAGGWPGSEELVRVVATKRRTAARRARKIAHR